MDPPPPKDSKPKHSVSNFLSKKWNKTFRRSPSPSIAQSSEGGPSVQSPSPSASPAGRSSLTPQASAQVSLTANTSTHEDSQNKHPTIVVSAEVADTDNTNKNDTNLAIPITPAAASHANQQDTSRVWPGLNTALRSLHKASELFPPLQLAVGTFVDCLDVLEEAAKYQQDYEELATELIALTKLLAQHMEQSNSARMSDSIANVARSIHEQANLIKKQRVRGTASRMIRANGNVEELERHYRRIGALFRQLQADANLSVWNIVNDQMTNTRLEGLMPVKLANYDSKLSEGISRRTCTANTRTAILSGLSDWSNNLEALDLYWMNGMAGTGKTTIACSFSESLEERKQLAASFFCTRTVPECREATRIIPTIAYQLARFSVPFQSALSEILGQDPDAGSKSMTKQFERLLKAPLLKVKEAIPNNLVVVIDALDECSDMREVELLLSILLKSVDQLPLKFFVTSRPEPEIYRRMLARVQGAGDVLHLHDVEKSLVQADIEVYVAEELEFMSPTPTQVKELAERSGNLFIYAATLVRYIRPGKGSRDPQKRLKTVLAMTSQPNKLHAEIDELYTAVLKAAIDAEGLEDEEVDDMWKVLRTVVCVQEPVDIDTLAAMAGLDDVQGVMTALDALRSVIHFSEPTGLVSTLHASFSDFIFDEARSKSFSCNLAEYSELLTRRCFEIMTSRLRFNICDLESSFTPDSDAENLEERVKQAVYPPLWYACRYWGDHLRHSPFTNSLCTLLSDFLSVRLLFWMEVLNLKREMHLGMGVLLKAKLWLRVGAAPADVSRLAEESRNFVTSFAANAVSQCTPHIYLSSLPFYPKSSSIIKNYWKNMKRTINATGIAMQRREVAPLASWNTQSPVRSAGYSPDGSCVAVGCDDGTVSVRDAYNGTLVAGPFHGHTGRVWSIGYSPDGSRIASGSEDNTIRVWSARDGTLLAGPFQGHTGRVLSVAFSPDGSRIVSGSWDTTARVWDAHKGTLPVGPFQGHTDPVRSVAYSPDGTHIVSGSGRTIRVWSAHDGTLMAGPFEGHDGHVFSVAYSPDGKRIVSGSNDKTVRVWSADDGKLLVGPLRGHIDVVWSVGYSPDGSRIVSGSIDRTIRVWDAHGGALLAGPFQGHTDAVNSVGYSPDGSRIISGSSDKTIRVWSAHEGTLPEGPLQEHASTIYSVAYSPDGSRIVSGSSDHTIRVWSAHDGKLLAGPFQGHTSWISSVSYSPDGSRIVSGSWDKTIRVWSAHDGSPLTVPSQGHTGPVRSVAYSPDGTRIASGSWDKTIRVWSANDGTPVADPFEGHTGPVFTIAYSPDGTRIASGSADKTIRVWSAHNGEIIAGPFQGHSDVVFSVGYSPDGSRIVSSSNDDTIRVWSAHDGALLAGPFLGHTGPVYSARFSPDGTCIASSSFDKTIRVWSSRDGTLLAVPFQGHTGLVWSVGYSPDGTRLVSGSVDETIRVWRVRDSARVTKPPEARTVSAISEASPSSTVLDSSSSRLTENQSLGPPTNDHSPQPSSAFASWVVRQDGWVVNESSQLLFWVPVELACFLPANHGLLVIYPPELFQIDHANMLLGEHWSQCYRPE